jgi:beta-phosphoglucomutase
LRVQRRELRAESREIRVEGRRDFHSRLSNLNSRLLRAVIFDVDGVLAGTDLYHYESWCELAEENGIAFHRRTFDARMRGLARMDALAVLLEKSPGAVSERRRIAMARRKDAIFKQILKTRGLEPMPGAVSLLKDLRARGMKIAAGSSSRNARMVLRAAKLGRYIEAVVDGSEAAPKPKPDIFLLAAKRLGVAPRCCVVIEDAVDGVDAARRAGMAVVAVGPPARFRGLGVLRVPNLAALTAEQLQREM